MIRALAALLLAAGAVTAEPINRIDPTELDGRLSGWMDFETLPLLPEPGLSHDAPLLAPGLALGERFVGQSLDGAPHDRLEGAPSAPLSLAATKPGEGQSTAYHAGFGSIALFPLGPAGFPAVEARGEGAVALLFATDITAFALTLHADYADPLGTRPLPGTATLNFYDRSGGLIDRHEITLGTGPLPLAFQSTGPGFAGVTLTNDDPGGLAVDDIRYPLAGFGS